MDRGWQRLRAGRAHFRPIRACCPACGELVTTVLLPTIEESRTNWDRLSDSEKQQVEFIERLRADFQHQKLTTHDQLPNISDERFTLTWDFHHAGLDSRTLIRHGEQVIFSEPAIYEGYERFEEVARILKRKYGDRIRDLSPGERSWTYL